jgi:heavy metal sensor kinase
VRELPIKTRLTLWYVTLIAVIMVVWSFGIVTLVRANLYTGIDRALASRASQIALELGKRKPAKFQDVSDVTLANVPQQQTVAQLLALNGAILEHSGGQVASESIVAQSLLEKTLATSSTKMLTIKRGDERFRLLIAPRAGTQQLLLVGSSTKSADDAVSRLVLVMLLTGPIVLAAAGVGGWLLARRALQPIVEMTSIAAEIGINRLDERVPEPPGNDEFTALARTLNRMLARLEEGVDDKRRLIGDASHELKTPLAVMRTEIDVALSAPSAMGEEAVEVLESAREETDRMARIVGNLLTLARLDEGTIQLLRKPINLRALADEAADSLQTMAEHRDIDVAVEGEGVVVLGDHEYLRQVVVNLIENAIKYSGEGTSISVAVESAGSEARVSVKDTGAGIPEEAQPHIFDRFYRVDRARSKSSGGSGLGLAICREIVEAHEGRMELTSRPGAGATFRMVLPVVPTGRDTASESEEPQAQA